MRIVRVLQDWGQLPVLAALLVGLMAWLRADIGRLDARIDTRFARIEARLAGIEARLSDLTERLAHIEGRLSVGAARPGAKD